MLLNANKNIYLLKYPIIWIKDSLFITNIILFYRFFSNGNMKPEFFWGPRRHRVITDIALSRIALLRESTVY